MWSGAVTKELQELFAQYMKVNDGYQPDEYDELNYDAMTYEEFVGFIKSALEQGVELPDVVPVFED